MAENPRHDSSGKAMALAAPNPGIPAPARRISSRQLRHLAQAAVLEETGTKPLVRAGIAVLCLATIAFAGWAAVTKVDELATAEGQVLPIGDIKTVQHLEGGVVSKILVAEGDTVKAGQALVELDAASPLSDLDQTRARAKALELKAERLRAFAEERAPNFAEAEGFDSLVAENASILRAQEQARESAKNVLGAQLAQKKSDAAAMQAQADSLDRQIANLSEIVSRREDLAKEGLVGRISLLDNKRELERVKGEREKAQSQAQSARQAAKEVEDRKIDQMAAMRKQAMDELGTTIAELAQVKESLGRVDDRVGRLAVSAPVAGRVQALSAKNPGAVIQPGGVVCQIVPVSTVMKVEARVLPRDVGHLKAGQSVRVKVTTYDFARYGAMPGHLESLSASSFLDEKQQPYFKAVIALERDWVGAEDENLRVGPGMTVQADVVTGSKTVAEYLLKPIHTQIKRAFHER